jgi:hypothetical protein
MTMTSSATAAITTVAAGIAGTVAASEEVW